MKKILFLSFMLVFTFLNQSLFSHSFHYEVQVTNALQVNNKKQLEALKLSWLYDGEVSKIMLQDQKDLNKLAKTLVNDLEKLGYFTQTKLNGKVLSFNKATNISLEKVNKGEYDVLQLHFTLPFKTAVNITGNSEISFDHEDPTAAAILYYEDARYIQLGSHLQSDCKASVKEKGDFTEGEFPQIIKIKCKS